MSLRVYALLLYLYPTPFRRRFGEAMMAVFSESCGSALSQGTCGPVIALWCSTLWDLVASGTAEHASQWSIRMRRAATGESVNRRVHALWIPAASCSAISMVLLTLSNGFLPTLVLHGTSLPLNWRWVFCLPLVGALGAELSRRGGGDIWHRILAALSPALGLCAFLCSCVLVLVATHPLAHIRAAILGLCILSWGILPGLALLLGTLPLVLINSQGRTPRPALH